MTENSNIEQTMKEVEEARTREETQKLAVFEAEIEAQARTEQRKELRHANLMAWQTGKADPSLNKNLESNIKKNTAFIKKCKTALVAESSQQLLNDIRKLSLEKYVSEIVIAIIEGMQKTKSSADIWAVVEVTSALHQRFPDTFTPLLTHSLAKVLAPTTKQQLASMTVEQREKEESSRVGRQRGLMRIAGELWLIGVLRNVEDGITISSSNSVVGVDTNKDNTVGLSNTTTKDRAKIDKDNKGTSGGFIYNILKDLFSDDKEHHINLPLAVSFLKYFGTEIFGIIPRKQRGIENRTDGISYRDEDKDDAEGIVTLEKRRLIKEVVMDYYASLCKHLVKEHLYIQKLERQNTEILFNKGELLEERKLNYEKIIKSHEKLLANTQTFADALDTDMPDLPEDHNTNKSTIIRDGHIGANEEKDTSGNGIWEDDDQRSFYENVVDLRLLVPGVLLEVKPKREEKDEDSADGIKDKAEPMGQSGGVATQDAMIEIMDKMGISGEDANTDEPIEDTEYIDYEIDSEPKPDENPETSETTGPVKPTQMAQVDTLIARLPNLINRDLIDSVAVEFCYINSKAARKKLAKALSGVQRSRIDLLPYYARMIATLNPYFPDVAQQVIATLVNDFKYLQKKKTQDLLESRTKNIRFIAELTKFRLVPQHIIFHCFKVLLDDFTHQNIDTACNLLEACGRFLYKNPDTYMRMANLLEIMMRKKGVQNLDVRQNMMIENAFYQCNPPERAAVVKKTRPPFELFLRKLIYFDLNRKSMDKVLKFLRKLQWDDKEVYRVVMKIFTKIWKIKYSNVHLMAILASGLNRYHSDFGVALVDHIIEDIRLGLEHNNFKHNQRRVATVKYLGELYNYRMVDSPLIFDTLYTIVTFGHDFGRPARERYCPLDSPDDFFRIRLVCTLLDSCGMCFSKGVLKKKLDSFLVFFQMYILSKSKMPMDVEFMLGDTLDLVRPQLVRPKTYEEANEAVDRMLLDQLKVVQGADGATKLQDDGFEESESQTSSDEDEDRVDRLRNGMEDESSEESSSSDVEGAGDEDNVVVITRKEQKLGNETDEEFERQFSQMMTESLESRRLERKATNLDVPIPMHLTGGQDRRTAALKSERIDGNMSFTLLTKKGNKQQTRVLEVPEDSALAVNTRSKQEAEREEQQQLKQLVLSYEEREEAVALAGAEEQMRNKQTQRDRKSLRTGPLLGYYSEGRRR